LKQGFGFTEGSKPLKLTDRLTELEAGLIAIVKEMQSLREAVADLEAQNQQLRTRLYAERDTKEGQEHLFMLYEEGFHVCPPHFAGSRPKEADCLFCLSFLKRRQWGDRKPGSPGA
jgi:regulator of replication initiation timing